MNRPLLSVLSLGLLLAAAAPAAAQPWRPGANDRLVEQALVDMGVDYRGADVRRAVQDAFREIVPGANWTRYRLNRAQAHAVAFTALGALGYSWTAHPPGRPRPQRLGDRGYGCRAASEQLYELALYVPNSSSLFLSNEEQARVRAGLTEVGRDANACGCRQLADGALAALRELNESTMPGREDTIDAVNELRRMAEACDAR